MNRFKIPSNITDDLLVNSLVKLSIKLINSGLYLSKFSLYELNYDENIQEFNVINRRKLRASMYKIEYCEHPDFIDDIDTFYGRLRKDLSIIDKEHLYHYILTLTCRNLSNK